MNDYLKLCAKLPQLPPGKMMLLPKKMKDSKAAFIKEGFEFIMGWNGKWNIYQMPSDWSLSKYDQVITFILDQKKRNRGEIIAIDGDDVFAILHPRYRIEPKFHYEGHLDNEISNNAISQENGKEQDSKGVQEAFLMDIATGRQTIICRCENHAVKWQDQGDCALSARWQMDIQFPGWSDPANWDENPASVLF